MASLGHLAVGLAAGRHYARQAEVPAAKSCLLFMALSMLPDADILGFGFGIAYEDPFGHRGATHSLVMALLVGALAAALDRRNSRLMFWLASATIASHGLLDTLTDGGLGAALLWPFDLHRYFAPWRPIPVAPIGLSFLSARGLHCILAELVLFSPIFLLAVWL
jgi:inner membrane protein